MNNKMISNKKVEELQKMSDDFARRKNSKVGFKILAGIVAGVSALTLVGCSDDENIENGPSISKASVHVIEYKNEFAETEERFEKELAEFLSSETGLEINLVNMKDVKIVSDEEENCLVIEGEMITDIIEGSKNCVITLKISNDQLELAKEYIKKSEYFTYYCGAYDGGMANLVNEDIASLRFTAKFINGLKATLDDKSTKVVGIYNKDTQEILYNRDTASR